MINKSKKAKMTVDCGIKKRVIAGNWNAKKKSVTSIFRNMTATNETNSSSEIIPASQSPKRTQDDLSRELYEAYSQHRNWQRYGLQLFLGLDVLHESLFDQADRLRIKSLCNCVYKKVLTGEDFRTVFASLKAAFRGYETRRDFHELLRDPYLMLEHAVKLSRPENSDLDFCQ